MKRYKKEKVLYSSRQRTLNFRAFLSFPDCFCSKITKEKEEEEDDKRRSQGEVRGAKGGFTCCGFGKEGLILPQQILDKLLAIETLHIFTEASGDLGEDCMGRETVEGLGEREEWS